jgi:hypothetical protein
MVYIALYELHFVSVKNSNIPGLVFPFVPPKCGLEEFNNNMYVESEP